MNPDFMLAWVEGNGTIPRLLLLPEFDVSLFNKVHYLLHETKFFVYDETRTLCVKM